MAAKLQLLAVALLASAAIAVNDSKHQLNIDSTTAKDIAATFEDVLNSEEPMLENEKHTAHVSQHHEHSLLRTAQRISTKGAAILPPKSSKDEKGAEWASSFEKDVSDLVMGLAEGGLSATPGMGDAIDKIKNLINTEMIPKVIDAHNKNQDHLDQLHTDIVGCGTTKDTELATATLIKNEYTTKSGLHKTCRGGEEADYKELRACRVSRKSKEDTKITLCETLSEEEADVADDGKNQATVTHTANEADDAYLERITSTVCGGPLDCTQTSEYCTDDNPSALKNAGDESKYKWLLGPTNNGFLDRYMKAKKACTEATVAYESETTRCEGLETTWREKKESCDGTQDVMDTKACEYAIDKKDACEKYEGCYSTHKNTFDTDVPMVRSEEDDRKAEWKGLMRMMCILDAFDGGINESEITACKTKTVDSHIVIHLDIDVPTLPVQVDCETPTEYPASSDYKKAEFVGLPVLAKGKMDANLCSGLKDVSLAPTNLPTENPDLCNCARVTVDGPYAAGPLVKCVHCQDVYRSNEANSCPAGTKLFAPRNRQDWHTFLASVSGFPPLREPNWIIDVTRPETKPDGSPAGCPDDNCGAIMNSEAGESLAPSKRWVTKDGHPWWLRSTALVLGAEDIALSGDYVANCYFDVQPNGDLPADADHVTFKDDHCTYHSKSYYCQPNDHAHPPKAGSPASCSCKQIALTGAYSAETVVKCERCLDIYKSTDPNSCPDGFKLWSPRTSDDLTTMLNSVGTYGLAAPNWIVDITNDVDNCGGCTDGAMNSNTATQAVWKTSDASAWFLSAAADDAGPKDDYKANCFLSLERNPENQLGIFFKSNACLVHSESYYCQPIKPAD